MIKLVSPLTEETVSINNGGGGNCSHYPCTLCDTIAITPQFNQVRVPEDYATLLEAVKHVEISCRLTTIVVGKGVHGVGEIVGDTCMIELSHLCISSSMNIIGDPNVPKEEIVFRGGIVVNKRYAHGQQAIVHVQHMTLRKYTAEHMGGWRRIQSSSFIMEDVDMEEGWLV